jgi:hypothetical protein
VDLDCVFSVLFAVVVVDILYSLSPAKHIPQQKETSKMNSETAPSDETSSVAPPSISSWVALGGEPHPNYHQNHCNLFGPNDDDDDDDHQEYDNEYEYDDWGVPNCQPSPPMDLSNLTMIANLNMETNTTTITQHAQEQQQQQQQDKENVLPMQTTHHPTSKKKNQNESEGGIITQKQNRMTWWSGMRGAAAAAAPTPKSTTPSSDDDDEEEEVDLPHIVSETDHVSTSETCHSNSSLLLGLSFCPSLPSTIVGASNSEGDDPTAVEPSVTSLPTCTTTDAVLLAPSRSPSPDIRKQPGDDHGICLPKTSRMTRTSAVSFGDEELELPKGIITSGSPTIPMMMEPDEWVGSDGCHATLPPRLFFPATDSGASISTIVTDRSSIVPASLEKDRRRLMNLPVDNPNVKPTPRHYSTIMAGRTTRRKASTNLLTIGTVTGRASQPGAIRISSKIPTTTPSSSRTLMSALTSSVLDDTSTFTTSTNPHRLPEAEALHDDEDDKYLPQDIEQMLVEGYTSTASSMVVNRSIPIALETADVCLVEENDKQDTDRPMWCGLARIWAVLVLVMLMVCVLLGSTLGTLLSGGAQRDSAAPADAITNNSNTQGNSGVTQGTIVPSYSTPTSIGTFTTMAPSENTSPIVVTPSPKSFPPSPKPSPSPSGAPTRSPVTPAPLVAAPAAATTLEPTPYVSPAPASSSTCIDSVQATQSCYDRSSMTQITVNFVNCQPRNDDWIAIFPSNEAFDYLLHDQLWVYACGGQSCSQAVNEGSVDIDPADYDTSESSRTLTPTDPNDGSYLFFPVPAGTYRVHLIREVGTGVVDPFVAYASSVYFTLSDTGC